MSDLPLDGEIDQLPADVTARVAELARRASHAEGPVMTALNAFGGRIESWIAHLPKPARSVLDEGSVKILTQLYRGAAGAQKVLPDAGRFGHRLAAALSGAAGGAAGIASAAVEMPATVMVMFSAMQKVAAGNGFDPQSEEVRLICIDIFGSGGPSKSDDGVNSTFLGSRLALNGTTVQALINRIAPAFSAMLGKQLASKAVPLIGAVAGAGVNFAFTRYYEEIAEVRFGVKRLVLDHGEDRIHHAFRAAMAREIVKQ